MNNFSKAVVSVLTMSAFLALSSGAETPEIKEADIWPSDIEHNSDVYVDAEVSSSADGVRFEARSNSEKVAEASMFDRNNDGYYTSATSFNVEGDKEYRVKVVAYSDSGERTTEEIAVRPECKISFLNKCLY